MGSEVGTPAARRRKLFAQADFVGLDRDERIELSRVILHRDITSWSSLTDEQVNRLLDAFEGYEKIRWLLENR
jgi:hypothetical protein